MTAPSDQPPRFTSGAVLLNPIGPRRSKHRDGMLPQSYYANVNLTTLSALTAFLVLG